MSAKHPSHNSYQSPEIKTLLFHVELASPKQSAHASAVRAVVMCVVIVFSSGYSINETCFNSIFSIDAELQKQTRE
jgi:hypothetical protein